MTPLRQHGQAIVEMLVVLVAILLLFWGLVWLQRWQQIKLQTQHHAALQAFKFSQSYELEQATLGTAYLAGLYSPIAHTERSERHALGVMPDLHPFLAVARQEGVMGSTQRWRFISVAQGESMRLQSQTSIWVGAGHANDADQAVARLAGSTSLWQYAQKNSQAAITARSPLLLPVDMAWGRKSPDTNWLRPWQESVPAHHLQQSQSLLRREK